jgi:hypothetical protein
MDFEVYRCWQEAKYACCAQLFALFAGMLMLMSQFQWQSMQSGRLTRAKRMAPRH